jgi:hypothetical protein
MSKYIAKRENFMIVIKVTNWYNDLASNVLEIQKNPGNITSVKWTNVTVRKVYREYKKVYCMCKPRKYLRFMMMISLYFTRERSTLEWITSQHYVLNYGERRKS